MSETDTPEKERPSDEESSKEPADAVSPPKEDEGTPKGDAPEEPSSEDEKAPPASAKEPPSEKEPDSAPPVVDGGEKEDKLIARGNPLQWLRGGVTMLGGGFLAFLLMAHDGQLRWGVPLGFVCILIAAFGLMALHALWATWVLARGSREACARFHRLSIAVWTIWLLPYFGGMAAGIARGVNG